MSGVSEKNIFSRLSIRSRLLRIAAALIAFAGMVISFVFFIRYEVMIFLICGIVCVLLTALSIASLFRKAERHELMISLCLVIVVVMVVVLSIRFPWEISSNHLHSYKKNMKYLSEKHFSTLFFPQILPEDVSKYKMEFYPDTFGEESYLCVSYNCSKDALDTYESEAQKFSVVSPLSLEEAMSEDLDEKVEEQIAESLGVETEELVFQLKFAFPKDIEKHSNARIYILACENDWSHPKTEAVMIDTDTGWVCFSKLF
ncbi:MAG: hypothetical protein J6Y58_11585 [Clostridiales bacterium]|nr:hypothetical protein [Clostridiales bacterium]